ncbi:DMT family transporter [Hymenobacter taeanensis]|uniref:DMT family transporter n=1 Tax=Hymenobacter taeanensis TaxID=2735321 RepID=A0A6M6BHW0_9BACT|nr:MULTISPECIES: DMT family transporter [Hymenobacter]QJX47757.1 DMT family transporter [Hymenobacter taeanensis]UOQ82757.1 DMT family transporter [Hymenobacter sp. 5414T-23]
MKNAVRVHAALFVVALIYAANYSISKDVMPRYMGPFGLVLLRIVGAALFFGIVSRIVAPQDRITGRADNLRAIACGLLGIGLNQLLFFSGLNLTSPINASLIQTVAPIVTVLASVVLLGEKLTLPRLLGIGLAGVGAALIILGRGHGPAAAPGQDTMLGNLFILLNATAFGVYLVIVMPLMRKYHPFTVLARIFLVGAVLAVPAGWQQVQQPDYASFPLGIWAAIVYMVVCLTIMAYLLNNWALKYASPSLLGAYIYLQPALAVLIAVSLGKDTLTTAKALQALLIFGGVFLVSRKPKHQPVATAIPLEPVQD